MCVYKSLPKRNAISCLRLRVIYEGSVVRSTHRFRFCTYYIAHCVRTNVVKFIRNLKKIWLKKIALNFKAAAK